MQFECLVLNFDVSVSVTLNHKRMCQVALTCLDEIGQLVSNYHVTQIPCSHVMIWNANKNLRLLKTCKMHVVCVLLCIFFWLDKVLRQLLCYWFWYLKLHRVCHGWNLWSIKNIINRLKAVSTKEFELEKHIINSLILARFGYFDCLVLLNFFHISLNFSHHDLHEHSF